MATASTRNANSKGATFPYFLMEPLNHVYRPAQNRRGEVAGRLDGPRQLPGVKLALQAPSWLPALRLLLK
jgi:hypothetical protein